MIVGIVGGGQLARMMLLESYSLGLRFVTLDPSADACAGHIGELIQAPYDNEDALRQLAGKVDVVTFEFENVPDTSVHVLSEQLPVYPPPEALGFSQDRMAEKNLFTELGIPTPSYLPVDSLPELEGAALELGMPLILKTRRLGYDGKGQYRINARQDILTAWEALGGVPLIAEQYIAFDREISIIAVRGQSGETRYYPVPENTHRNGILHLSVCRPGDPRQADAESYIDRLLDRLNYVGVLTLELFEHEGRLLANEIAPRVHNSGHWTIEGSQTSQFENHVRAITGLPLGSTAAKGCSVMVNFIGNLPDRAETLALFETISFHAYGKEPRPGRKVGHGTINTVDAESLEAMIPELSRIALSASEAMTSSPLVATARK